VAGPHRSGRGRTGAAVVLAALLVIGGAGWWTWLDDDASETDGSTPRAAAAPSASEAAPEPTGWGPTEQERRRATSLADALPLEDLAGQLIVARSFSNEASLDLVRDKHFAGVMVTGQQSWTSRPTTRSTTSSRSTSSCRTPARAVASRSWCRSTRRAVSSPGSPIR
jgi:hypothetical protein